MAHRIRWTHAPAACLLGLALLFLPGCGGGSGTDGEGGGSTPPTTTGLTPPGAPALSIGETDPLPGVAFAVVGTSGGSGPGGNFRPGDFVTVQFTLKTDLGVTLDLSLMDSGSAYLSGPTFNYNIVIPRKDDLRTVSLYLGNATWQYTFPVPLPAVYDAPYNDTVSFGTVEGELTGQPLLDGTYSIGLETSKLYTVDGESLRDPGSLVVDILLGSATAIDTHEVVTDAHCNQCHSDLRFHGDRRAGVRICALCHTSGAEDRNNPALSGGTPKTSIDFRVMIHKIHNGKHLPSVLGMTTDASGNRVYAQTTTPLGVTTPYKLVGFNTLDASEFGFPVMPSAYVAYLFDAALQYTGTGGNGPMPRDLGYGALTLRAYKLAEDTMRAGVVSCVTCHGDPDGPGPVAAPLAGLLHESQSSRHACGSCHDDIDWSKPYVANNDTMPPNPGACNVCHPASTTGPGLYPVRQSHLHPYSNPALNTGVNVLLPLTGAVTGGSGTGGRHIAGDAIAVTFSVRNNAGTDLQINSLQRFQAIVTGPTTNPQALAPNATVFDSGFRKSSPFTSGTGSIDNLSVGPTAVDEVLAVVFTGTNTFDVVGSVSGTVTAAQVVPGAGAGTGSLTLTAAGVTFRVNDTGTDFAAGDRFFLEVIPTAPTYTKNMVTDISFERVGVATGAAQTLTVAHLPLYWGRQSVMERTAFVGAAAPLGAASAYLGRYVVADSSLLVLGVGDRVVVGSGATEEYLQVGRVQTLADGTSADLGALDRIWFTTALRFAHPTTDTIQEVTLAGKREGLTYTVSNAGLGQLSLIAGQFTAGNPVVVSYRSHLRFGRWRYPGDALQAIYPDPVADSDDINESWGDWKGLPLLEGTYTVGFWVNRDFSVSGNLGSGGESTQYRMISPPATANFVFGTTPAGIVPRAGVAVAATCNECHGDLTFHGNGRRGLETCLMCHSVSGMEDGPKYTFSAFPQANPTPGVTMDFRALLHKIHHGKELAQPYEAVGVFLGVPYPATYGEIGFPAWPAESGDCAKCHGAGSTAWHAPAARSHPGSLIPVRTWRSACGSCHDSTSATAHIDINTSPGGYETCNLCHGPGAADDAAKKHVVR